jgi:hypothetical protein
MVTEYKLYSDERYYDNRCNFFGGLICTDLGVIRINTKCAEVRERFKLVRELKWGKISKDYLEAYKAWADIFFDDPFARFVGLKIDTTGTAWREFNPQDRKKKVPRDDKLKSAFHQFLLVSFGPLRDTKRWTVFHDAGLFKKDSVLNTIEFRFNKTYKRAFGQKTSRIIRFARSIDSKSKDLIQLVDVLLGVFSCIHLSEMPASEPKKKLCEHCQTRLSETGTTQKKLPRLTWHQWLPPDKFLERQKQR